MAGDIKLQEAIRKAEDNLSTYPTDVKDAILSYAKSLGSADSD